MRDELSEHMRRTIEEIRTHGGTATPARDGYWKGADGQRLEYGPLPGTPNTALNLKTRVKSIVIYALAERNILKRAGKNPSRRFDTYVLTEPPRDHPGPAQTASSQASWSSAARQRTTR
jgi:hypothetical protein